jgi:UDP-glucose 4-epimerase
MTVFVTGAAGFIGPHVVRRLLDAGARVVGFDNYFNGSPVNLPAHPALSLEEGDLRDPAALRAALTRARPEAIVHLAAIHYIPYCNAHPQETLQVNVAGTHNLFEAAQDLAVRRIVQASSAAVYPIQSEACREDGPLGPTDIYGATKVACEALGQSFAAQTGVPVVSARLFNVYGPGETNPHVIPEIVQQLTSDAPIRLGNLSPKRDYVHVTDVARALHMLLDVPAPDHDAYNVGTGSEYSVTELVDVLSGIIGREIAIESEAARVRRLDRPHLLPDISKIEAATGWTPQVDLAEGLAELAGRPVEAA